MKYSINRPLGAAYSDNNAAPNDKSDWIKLKLPTCLIQLADCFQKELPYIVNSAVHAFVHSYLIAFEQLGLQVTESCSSHIDLVFKNLTMPIQPLSLDGVLQHALKSCLSQNIILCSREEHFILYEHSSEESVLHVTDTVVMHREIVRNLKICKATEWGNLMNTCASKVELNSEEGKLWLNIQNIILIQESIKDKTIEVHAVGRKPILIKQTLNEFHKLASYHFVLLNDHQWVNLQHIILDATQCTILTTPQQIWAMDKIYQHAIWEQWSLFLLYTALKNIDTSNFLNILKMLL